MGADKNKPVKTKYLGHDISRGLMDLCETCAEAKAKRKQLSTRIMTITKLIRPKEIAKVMNEHISIDILMVRVPSEVKTTQSPSYNGSS
eukprot:4553449-Ditylum_brightwellii.AAC.1